MNNYIIPDVLVFEPIDGTDEIFWFSTSSEIDIQLKIDHERIEKISLSLDDFHHFECLPLNSLWELNSKIHGKGYVSNDGKIKWGSKSEETI